MKKLITLDEAIEELNKAHQIDPAIHGKNSFEKQTLYNALYRKKLKRFGPRHFVQLDLEEVMNLFGPKKAG